MLTSLFKSTVVCARPTSIGALASLLFALHVAGGCTGEDPLDEVTFELRAADAALDFGDVPVGAFIERSTFLLNDGTAAVALAAPLGIEGAPEGAYSVIDSGDFPLEPNGYTEVRVRFAPTVEGESAARLVARGVVDGVEVVVDLVGRGVAPTVTLSPEEIDFGALAAGETTTAVLTVGNTGESLLSVRLAVDGRGYAFDDGSDARRVDVAVGATLDVTLRFSPDGGGPFAGRVVAETCGPLCGPGVVLVGEGIAPRIEITPRPIDLGEVLVGNEHRAAVVVKNIGVGTLSVSAVSLVDALGALRLETPTMPLVLEGGAEASVDVIYTALVPEGAYVATLLVDSSDPLQSRVSVPITASTPGARLRVVPAAVHFGLVDPGQTRTADVVAISTGTTPITLSTAYVVGPAFTLASLPPTLPALLAPGESVLLTVAAVGTADAVAAGGAGGSLHVEVEEGEQVLTSLTFASGTEGCQPRASTENLNLGFVRLGQGATGTILVDNIGTGDCTLVSAGPRLGLAYDAGFSHSVLATVLPSGDQMSVLVAYQASSVGQAKAFIDMRFAEQPAPLLVSATATGVDGAVTAVPPSVSLGPVVVGCTLPDTRTISFINEGAFDATVATLAFDPPTSAATFTLPALPQIIPPGGFLNVTLSTTGLSPGIATTTLVADVVELGPVPATVTIETSASGTPVTETFVVADIEGKVDILFVVDDSGSMFDDQQILAANFESFIQAAAANGASDFHIGITSTDLLSEGALAGRFTGSPAVLTNSTPNLVGSFAERAVLGSDGAGLELGLDAMRLALSEPLASSTNAGFHRAEAALSIIIVSDEDDSGLDAPAFGFTQFGHPLETYMAFLDALKGGVLTEAPVLFSAVVDPSFSPRYTTMATNYGGVVLDITSSSWGSDLTEIADATFALQRLFRLATPAQTGSANVLVDGQPASFVIDVNGNVVLNDPPSAGAVVEITYVPAC
jgi:hypothetical protein